MPSSFHDYEASCAELVKGAPLRFALLREAFPSADAARLAVSDTLGGRDDRQGEGDLARLHHPLGKVFQGRKTSPLRFRIVRLDRDFHIAAIWDDRTKVTGNQPGDLAGVIDLLAQRGKTIGRMMKADL
ncbi:MAG: hypothetical protein NTW21_36760 [Verrucomicrobia bacterium]|nr:hypothetical protein [Verrucomicrobiota bacterium]